MLVIGGLNGMASEAFDRLWEIHLLRNLITFGLAGSFALAVGAYWAAHVFRRANQPLYTAWLNRGLDPEVRATVHSMAGQVDAIGQVAGGPVLGVVATAASVRAALVASGVILSPALALYARAIRRGGEG